jgi:heme oxygenase
MLLIVLVPVPNEMVLVFEKKRWDWNIAYKPSTSAAVDRVREISKQ